VVSPPGEVGLLLHMGLRVERLDVARSMEDGYEQTWRVPGRRMEHGHARREVTVGARTDDVVVDREAAFEHDDRLRSGVSMQLRLESRRVADEVVLRPGLGVLVQQPHADVPVVDDRPGRIRGRRCEAVRDDRLAVFHGEQV
jgi:hypothetical protein